MVFTICCYGHYNNKWLWMFKYTLVAIMGTCVLLNREPLNEKQSLGTDWNEFCWKEKKKTNIFEMFHFLYKRKQRGDVFVLSKQMIHQLKMSLSWLHTQYSSSKAWCSNLFSKNSLLRISIRYSLSAMSLRTYSWHISLNNTCTWKLSRFISLYSETIVCLLLGTNVRS